MNETTELIMRQLNAKKVHAETHEVGGGDEIDVSKLKNIEDYVTIHGDFAGTWNGVEMTSVEPGLSSAFNALKADVTQRAINVTVSPYTADLTGTVDSTATIQAALNAVSTSGGGMVYLPRGTYLVSSITIPSNITILTAGKSTVIKQKSGVPTGTRVIVITGSNIEISDMTITGNIATDTDEQAHGIHIQGSSGSITNIKLGKICGTNIRGDVVYIGGLAACPVTNVKIDSVMGTNIYRNVVTITGAEDVDIGSITGTQVGLMMFDIEPNSNSMNTNKVRIGYIKGGTCGVVGYQSSVLVYGIQFDNLNLDPSFQTNSTPAYPLYNVSIGIQLRSCRGIYVGYYKANNFTAHAVKYITVGGDLTGRNFIFNQINFTNCSTTETTYNAAMLLASVDNTSINSGIVTNYDATKSLIMGDSGTPTNVRVNVRNVTINGKIAAYVGYSTFENIFVNSAFDVSLIGSSQNVRIVNSQITLGRLADYCTKLIIENTAATCATFVFNSGYDFHFIINSTLNTVYIVNGAYKQSYLMANYFGGYYMWVDATGKARIKSGVPTTDLDGTVIGTQT